MSVGWVGIASEGGKPGGGVVSVSVGSKGDAELTAESSRMRERAVFAEDLEEAVVDGIYFGDGMISGCILPTVSAKVLAIAAERSASSRWARKYSTGSRSSSRKNP